MPPPNKSLSDVNLDDEISQPEYVQYRNSVYAMEKENGQPIWNPGDWNKALGPNAGGRTWRELHAEMKIFQKNVGVESERIG